MRSANGLLNAAGMCCEMTIAGASGGIAQISSRIASVPPVEAPTAMMRSVVRSTRRAVVAGSTASALRRGSIRRTAGTRLAACVNARARGHLHFRNQFIGVFRQSARDVDLRLRHEIDRAEFESAQGHLCALLRQGGNHHDRHRPEAHQVFEEREAVHPRHLDIERDDVRFELLDTLARGVGISRGADHFNVPIPAQHFAQELSHQRRVVNDENFDAHDRQLLATQPLHR